MPVAPPVIATVLSLNVSIAPSSQYRFQIRLEDGCRDWQGLAGSATFLGQGNPVVLGFVGAIPSAIFDV